MAIASEALAAIAHRRDLYRVLASMYFNVLTEAQIEDLAGRDYASLTTDENELIASGFNDIRRYLRKRHTGTRQELAMDFTSCFLGARTYEGLTAAPYESLYLDASGLLMGRVRHDVFEAYKRERVALQKGIDYADDHLSFEFEFMAILCERTLAALEQGDETEALRTLDVQHSFVTEHINRWFTRFHNLTTRFVETRFYRGVLNVTQGFLDEEPDLIDAIGDAIERGPESHAETIAETQGAA